MTSSRYQMALQIEVAAWSELFASAPAAIRQRLGLSVTTIGDAVVLLSTAVDHPLFNRALASHAEGELELIRDIYDRAGVRHYFIQRRKRTGALDLPVGLIRYRRNWIKLVGAISDARLEPARSKLVARSARPNQARAVGELFCLGFGMPAAAADLFGYALVCPGWNGFVACDEIGTIAGVALLYRGQRIGYLSGAVTAPRFRSQGVQQMLIAERVRAAAEAGCTYLVSETGEDVPGDPQHSLNNLTRYGLAVAGVTENLAPPGCEWNHGVRLAKETRP